MSDIEERLQGKTGKTLPLSVKSHVLALIKVRQFFCFFFAFTSIKLMLSFSFRRPLILTIYVRCILAGEHIFDPINSLLCLCITNN